MAKTVNRKYCLTILSSWILFASCDSHPVSPLPCLELGPRHDLVISDVDGGNEILICNDAESFNPLFEADKEHPYIVCKRDDGAIVTNLDGIVLADLKPYFEISRVGAPFPDNNSEVFFRISASGQYVTYWRATKVYKADLLNPPDVVQIMGEGSAFPDIFYAPVFSRDFEKAIVTEIIEDSGFTRISELNFETHETRFIVELPSYTEIMWAADEQAVIYSNDDGISEISLDGQKVTELYPSNYRPDKLQLSPDGSSLIYEVWWDGDDDYFQVLDLETRQIVDVQSSRNDASTQWLNDNELVILERVPGGDTEIVSTYDLDAEERRIQMRKGIDLDNFVSYPNQERIFYRRWGTEERSSCDVEL